MPLEHPEVDEGGQRLEDALVARVDRRGGRLLGVVLLGLGVRAGEERRSAAAAARRRRPRAACPRRIAGIASAGRTWLASSKTTTSKYGSVRGQHLGDDQRAHRPARLDAVMMSGAAENSWRIARCRRFLRPRRGSAPPCRAPHPGGDCLFGTESADALRSGLDVLVVGAWNSSRPRDAARRRTRRGAVAELDVPTRERSHADSSAAPPPRG